MMPTRHIRACRRSYRNRRGSVQCGSAGRRESGGEASGDVTIPKFRFVAAAAPTETSAVSVGGV